MRQLLKFSLSILIVSMSFCPVFAADTNTEGVCSIDEKTGIIKDKSALNLNLDKESAIKIAEIILVKIYGEKVLKQKPWSVSENDNSFKIRGTTVHTQKGGVAEIIINKSDARILHVIHER